MISRVVTTITNKGRELGYFSNDEASTQFASRLTRLLLEQKFSFNSPVYFNVGVQAKPQCWACLILGVDDYLKGPGGIEDWWTTEAETFRSGSGSGVNLSSLRHNGAPLSGGKGVASGPVSFMRPADSIAGTVTSGGRTRRAAKMVILNASHPDVDEFIETKLVAERVSRTLADNGFDIGLNGEHQPLIYYQNANNSVRFTNEDMIERSDVLRKVADAAWQCGDPGVQFHDNINKWNTAANVEQIVASNPCSEYMFLNDTVCNLGSFNLVRYLRDNGTFDTDSFVSDIGIAVIAMDILVDLSSYPNARIAIKTHSYRTLGLGYANLGALLMSMGYAYDSDAGRSIAGAITALLTGAAYDASSKLARKLGPYPGWKSAQESHKEVIKLHQSYLRMGDKDLLGRHNAIWKDAGELWNSFLGHDIPPMRNAQVTVLAPTGTIGLFMDCETLGIEPALAISARKELVGGGEIDFGVRECVERGLGAIHAAATGNTEGYLKPDQELVETNPVFATALGYNGQNVISPEGHVDMMAAVQPFLSGAISKTVNMPATSTASDVEGIYKRAWEKGLKSIAIYRDGSKTHQPLTSSSGSSREEFADKSMPMHRTPGASRRKPNGTREGWTHRFDINGHTFYLTVNEFSDGNPCEIFLRGSKHGSTVNGLLEAFSIAVSIGLQYGVPLSKLLEHFIGQNFAPQGVATGDSDIKFADSLIDYTFKMIQTRYTGTQKPLPIQEITWDRDYHDNGNEHVGHGSMGIIDYTTTITMPALSTHPISGGAMTFCPSCYRNSMVQSGSCLVCTECGETTGCS